MSVYTKFVQQIFSCRRRRLLATVFLPRASTFFFCYPSLSLQLIFTFSTFIPPSLTSICTTESKTYKTKPKNRLMKRNKLYSENIIQCRFHHQEVPPLDPNVILNLVVELIMHDDLSVIYLKWGAITTS